MIETILWRRIDLPGHEIARLEEVESSWRLSGTAIFQSEQGPAKLDYLVLCDSAWRTIQAQVIGTTGGREINLTITVDAQRRWDVNGVESGAVQGCIDIDLGFSPATNLLPLRRLGLAVGEQAQVIAAWLPFPSLAFEPLPQVYRREGESTYRYESGGGAFSKMLDVDAIGFVTSYPGLWKAEETRM